MNEDGHSFRPRLSLKFLGALSLALSLAFSAYLLVYQVGVPWFLYGDRFASMWEETMQGTVTQFQSYVDERDLSSRDSASIQAWQQAHPQVYLFLDDLGDYADDDFGHPVAFSDGTLYVSAYVSDAYYSTLGWIVAMTLAALCFLLVMFPFVYHLLRRLGRLSREMDILTAGNLEHEIAVKGRDELSALGENIDRLRRSVLERIQREQAAVQANRELVTALSHDLRTPLTKQIGYLEILQRHMYRDEAEQQDYQERVWKKAIQMKDLSDRIFQHFQVNGESPPQLSEIVSGNELLGQILEEQRYDLTCQGFSLSHPVFPKEFLLEVSPEDLLRVFDNLFSNLKKYADPNRLIPITIRQTQDEVCIRIENQIQSPAAAVESHQIGLNTVRTLLSRNHGRIEVLREGDRYRTDVFFQIIHN